MLTKLINFSLSIFILLASSCALVQEAVTNGQRQTENTRVDTNIMSPKTVYSRADPERLGVKMGRPSADLKRLVQKISTFKAEIPGTDYPVTCEDIVPLGPALIKQPQEPSFWVPIPGKYKGSLFEAVFDGQNYLVVWCDWGAGGIRGTRITQSGKVLDPDGFMINENCGGFIRLAAGRHPETGEPRVLVVWTENYVGASYPRVRGAVVTPKAQVYTTLMRPEGGLVHLTGPAAVKSKGTSIFPQALYNQYGQKVAWLDTKYPEVSFNGRDFVVSAVARCDNLKCRQDNVDIGTQIKLALVNPSNASVRRDPNAKRGATHPWDMPVIVDIDGYGKRPLIACSPDGLCLFISRTWNPILTQFSSEVCANKMTGTLVNFNDISYSIGKPRLIAETAVCDYHPFSLTADRNKGFFIAWDDLRYYKSEKIEPGWNPNPWLFSATYNADEDNPLKLLKAGWGPIYNQNNIPGSSGYTSYRPHVAYGGYDYSMVWTPQTTDVRLEWFNEACEKKGYSPINPKFWGQLNPEAKEFVKTLFSPMYSIYSMGAYVAPDGKLVDAFALLQYEAVDGHAGYRILGHNKICWGGSRGLWFYEWRNLHDYPGMELPEYGLRAKFVTKPNFAKLSNQNTINKIGLQPEINPAVIENLLKNTDSH